MTTAAANDLPDTTRDGMLDRIAVLILTYNEADNIERTLAALARFTDIVVLDSASTDATTRIAEHHPHTRLSSRPFDGHAAQWNHGLENCGIERPWVLALDADYVLPATLVEEIARLRPDDVQSGYEASFRYCVHGRRLTASLYPPHVVLFRRDRARFVQEGHTQRVLVEGRVSPLAARIDHDDRKPLARWLASQQRYARLEADFLLSRASHALRPVDRIRRYGVFAPFIVFFYTLLWKRCIFDGWPGWLYVLQRTLAEIMIAAEIVDRRMGGKGDGSSTPPTERASR